MRSIDISDLGSKKLYNDMEKYYLPYVVFDDLIPISFLRNISDTIYGIYNKEFSIRKVSKLPIFFDEKVKFFKI